jgi:peptide deformylase
MALLEIIKYGNPILRQEAKEIKEINNVIRTLASEMIQTMQAAEGIGLAAPQVAQSVALVVVDVGFILEGEKAAAFINPEILAAEGEFTMEEGCLSVPEVREEVVRPEKIHIKYLTIDGGKVDTWYDGLLARVLQHEMDHLKGIFFVDHLGTIKKKTIKKDLKRIARDELLRIHQAA